MPLIFAQTTATLAPEFIQSVREDNLDFHLSRISEENGVVVSKQQSHYTVFGHWDAITIAYKSLSSVLSGGINCVQNSGINTPPKCLLEERVENPKTAWSHENSLKSAEVKGKNDDFPSSSHCMKMFTAASNHDLSDNESNMADLPRDDFTKDLTKVSMTVRNKAGRKPGSTVKPKEHNPPEPLTFIYSKSDELEDTFEPVKHNVKSTLPQTNKENVTTSLPPESSKLETQTDTKTESATVGEKGDVLGPAIHEIKVEKDDNFADTYDEETDIEEQYLSKDDNDLGDTNSNVQNKAESAEISSKENRGKKSEGQKNSEEFKCLLCPYVGKKRINLKDHMKRHRSKFTCEVCNKTFGLKKDYVRHCNKHNKVKKPKVKRTKRKKQSEDKSEYSCDTCSYVTSTKDNLKDHIKRTHIRKFTCSVCSKPFGSRRDVNRHRNYVHGEPKFFCSICKKHYKTSRTYNDHLKTHEEGYVKPEFPCDICNKSFSTKYVLNHHVKVEHLGVRKAYMCPTCGRSFTQKGSYVAHATVHLGIKPYVCDKCGKAFSYEKSLREHKYIHETINRFQCQFCEKGFKQSTSLKLHLKVHAGARDYICVTCGKGFTQKQALERHERIHSGSKPYLCSLCNKTFNDTSIIRRHMILVHKKHSDRWREGVVHTEKSLSEDHPFYISQTKDKTNENSSQKGKETESSNSTEYMSMDKVRWENPPIKFDFCDKEFLDRQYKEKTLLDAHNRCVSPSKLIEQDIQSSNSEITGSGAATQTASCTTYLNPNPLSSRSNLSILNGSGTQSNEYTSQTLRWGASDYQTCYMNSVNQQ